MLWQVHLWVSKKMVTSPILQGLKRAKSKIQVQLGASIHPDLFSAYIPPIYIQSGVNVHPDILSAQVPPTHMWSSTSGADGSNKLVLGSENWSNSLQHLIFPSNYSLHYNELKEKNQISKYFLSRLIFTLPNILLNFPTQKKCKITVGSIMETSSSTMCVLVPKVSKKME